MHIRKSKKCTYFIVSELDWRLKGGPQIDPLGLVVNRVFCAVGCDRLSCCFHFVSGYVFGSFSVQFLAHRELQSLSVAKAAHRLVLSHGSLHALATGRRAQECSKRDQQHLFKCTCMSPFCKSCLPKYPATPTAARLSSFLRQLWLVPSAGSTLWSTKSRSAKSTSIAARYTKSYIIWTGRQCVALRCVPRLWQPNRTYARHCSHRIQCTQFSPS